MALPNLATILSSVVPAAKPGSVTQSKIAALQRAWENDRSQDPETLAGELAGLLEGSGVFLEDRQVRALGKAIKKALR